LRILHLEKAGNTEIVKLIQEADSREEELLEACIQGNLEVVKRLLEQNVNVNAKDNEGNTALIVAAAMGQTETVEFLIYIGADINVKTSCDETALTLAVSKGHTEIANLLREAGAKE
jgi:ankyrin repeat protein